VKTVLTFWFLQRRGGGISWLAVRLSASQEGVGSMQFVRDSTLNS
jgi:hypothetical protein